MTTLEKTNKYKELGINEKIIIHLWLNYTVGKNENREIPVEYEKIYLSGFITKEEKTLLENLNQEEVYELLEEEEYNYGYWSFDEVEEEFNKTENWKEKNKQIIMKTVLERYFEFGEPEEFLLGLEKIHSTNKAYEERTENSFYINTGLPYEEMLLNGFLTEEESELFNELSQKELETLLKQLT